MGQPIVAIVIEIFIVVGFIPILWRIVNSAGLSYAESTILGLAVSLFGLTLIVGIIKSTESNPYI